MRFHLNPQPSRAESKLKKAPNKLSFEINKKAEFPFEETKTKHIVKKNIHLVCHFFTRETRAFDADAHTRHFISSSQAHEVMEGCFSVERIKKGFLQFKCCDRDVKT